MPERRKNYRVKQRPARIHGVGTSPIKEPPYNLDAEEGLLGSCIIDAGTTLELCVNDNLVASAFYKIQHRIIYDALLDIRKTHPDALDEVILSDYLMAKKVGSLEGREYDPDGDKSLLEYIGGDLSISRLTSRIETTVFARHYLSIVQENYKKRQLINALTTANAKVGESIQDAVKLLKDTVEDLENRQEMSEGRTLASFQYPSCDDPTALLGRDRFLNRGGALLMVSSAGVGKSTMSTQMAVYWGAGRPFMGIPCTRPLRSLILQAEDDDGDIGEFAESLRQGLPRKGFSQQEMETALGNVIMVKDNIHVGEDFARAASYYANRYKPDLFILNPLYSFAGGDLVDTKLAAEFLSTLAKVNRGDKFAWILIHHTGKPQHAGKEGKGGGEKEWWEQYYAGFGSSYLTNMVRATALLKPRDVEGEFFLELGKRGARAGMMEKKKSPYGYVVNHPTKKLPIRYSRDKIQVKGRDGKMIEKPMIMWEESEYEEPKPEDVKKQKQEQLVTYIAEALMREQLGSAEIFRKLKTETDLKPSKDAVTEAIEQLLSEGRIRKVENSSQFKSI